MTVTQSPIDFEFYEKLWPRMEALSQSMGTQALSSKQVTQLLEQRDHQNGLSIETLARLSSLLHPQALPEAIEALFSASTTLRQKLFQNRVSLMVPIELSSYCASSCRFCGWKVSNGQALRLRISQATLKLQLEKMVSQGWTHFELSAGDDAPVISQLEKYIEITRQSLAPHHRISLCVVPLRRDRYASLKKAGLQTVLTWQETYCPKTYREYIPTGPKAWGWGQKHPSQVGSLSRGYYERISSQEEALSQGLQVGLGYMLGLHAHSQADFLSAIRHAQMLKQAYPDSAPLIFGMPTWNGTHSDPKVHGQVTGEAQALLMQKVAALYLLGMGDHQAWVFPNCRVSPEAQLKCLHTAGCFTSTMVNLSPGGYLAEHRFENEHQDIGALFEKTSLPLKDQKLESIREASEQFMHSFHPHSFYENKFSQAGLTFVSEQLLSGQPLLTQSKDLHV